MVGRSHILVDFPRVGEGSAEPGRGRRRRILEGIPCSLSGGGVINWSRDERGEYEWVVILNKSQRQPKVDSPEVVNETYWYYLRQGGVKTYRRVDGAGAAAEFGLSQGPHALYGNHACLFSRCKLSDGLWLMNKAAQLQLEHFNKSNALGWAITMGLFAMPVIYSDREWNQIVGESYYIQLGPERQVWMDGAGRQGLPDRRRQPRDA